MIFHLHGENIENYIILLLLCTQIMKFLFVARSQVCNGFCVPTVGKIKSLVSYDFCKLTILWTNKICVFVKYTQYARFILRTLNCYLSLIWSRYRLQNVFEGVVRRKCGCKCKRLIRLCQFVSNQLWFVRFFKGYVNFIFTIWVYHILLNCLKA